MSKSKKWILKGVSDEAKQSAKDISEAFGLENATAEILVSRGYNTPEKVSSYLRKENTLMYNPFLLTDMDKAVKRTLDAVEKGEKIVVYGDYDVDGVTAVSVLYLYLKSLGANVDYYIPSRIGEGYGINVSALDKLKSEGCSLVITVDTGITAISEAEYMKKLGLSLVVTDHHDCHNQLPLAEAVVDPRRNDDTYPFKELAGVGVVFKLVTALEFTVQERQIYGKSEGLSLDERFARMTNGQSDFLEKVLREYADLVTLGTISDVMTLTDENRLICSLGLSFIENAPRIGLSALMDYADGLKARKYPKKRKVSASYIGFTVAPRINAAGRIADASIGVELFTTDNRERADEIAAELCELNTQRQAEENRISTEAMELAQQTHDFANDKVIVLASESWHHGVIGIVASRLTEKYGLPSILISVEDGVGKGSGRSIKGLNLSEALSSCSDILIRYGGHELAAGLTVSCENIELLRRRLNNFARENMSGDGAELCIEIDREVKPDEITLKLATELSYMEPFGVGNSQPVLMLKGANVNSVDSIGEGKHTKFNLDGMSALMFGVSREEADVREGEKIDAVFKLDINEFRGQKTEQMLLCDIRPSNLSEDGIDEAEYLLNIEKGQRFCEQEDILPTRDDFAEIFRFVREYGENGVTVSLRRLSDTLGMRGAKIKLALEILSDVGLIGFTVLAIRSISGSELYKISAARSTEKINLFGALRYKNVKNLMIKD